MTVKWTTDRHPFTSHSGQDLCVWSEEGSVRHCGHSADDYRHQGNGLGHCTIEDVSLPADDTASIPAVKAWDLYSERVRELIVEKNETYGDAWLRQGYMGNLARVMSKTARLQNMLWRDDPDGYIRDHHGESVQDTVYDQGALLAFLVWNLGEENRWG